MLHRISILLFTAALLSCGDKQADPNDGVNAITREGLEEHVKVLASDEFQGRKPFTEGEKKTVEYLVNTYKQLGLEPGNGDSFLQDVPMAEITTTTSSTMQVKAPGSTFELRGFDDFILNTQRTDSLITWKDEEVVFAGFGIVAPEYNWNDYAGLDVKGKIVLVLVNDPGFGNADSTFFKGNTMTYYGRWTYKYEEAARQGAKGCFVIHNTVPAGYPFGVLQVGWNAPHLYLDQRGKQTNYCEGIGWITKEATEKLFAAAGFDFNEHQTKARQPGFTSFSLNTKVSATMQVKTRYNNSPNVIGKITGTKRPDEYIIYTAHWDHLGIGKKDASGDSIYNGAHDNASGTAAMLQMVKAFKSMKNPPERTVVFLAVTAEEQGLLGSAYYAQNPVFPKEKTVANINIDGMNPYGKMTDVLIVGAGQSELEDYLREAVKAQGREVRPDTEPEKGYYFRSDHFNFAKIGIPALYIKAGDNLNGKGIEGGIEAKAAYVGKYYHQPSDEFDSNINFEGAVDDMQLLFLVGKRLANETSWPSWKEGSEFKAARDSYMKK